jgi:pre-mRNA-processing factor 19
VTGEDLTVEDLVDLKQARVVRPRPPTLTSIPALLSAFQNEWDALNLETYQLKQQLAETRQELSTALYYSDSAEKVIARLQKERDEARDALAKISVTSTSNGANGDAMQVDGQGLPEAIVAKIEQTQTEYVDRESSNSAPANMLLSDCHQPDESARHPKVGLPPIPCRLCKPTRTRNPCTLEAARLPSTRQATWHLLEEAMAWLVSTQYHKDRLFRH